MTNIIVHGFVSNKLITQGYHAGAAAAGGDSYHYYYGKRRPSQETKLFIMVKELLEAL